MCIRDSTWACGHVLGLLDRTDITATPDETACALADMLNNGLDPDKASKALADMAAPVPEGGGA